MWVFYKRNGEYLVGFPFTNLNVTYIEIIYEYSKIKDAEQKVHYLNGGK